MRHVIVLPVVIPLAAAIVCLTLHAVSLALQRAVAVASLAATLVIAAILLQAAGRGEIVAYAIGAWQAPFGIVLVLDRLSAIMLVLTAVLALPALVYAMAGLDMKGRLFHPLFQFQVAGINGAFLTGDLFNLFVFFEMLLLASYGLLAIGGGVQRARAGLVYVVLNIAGSALFLVGLALVYGMLGSLNIADISFLLPSVPRTDQALVRAAMAFLILVFALKAALAPLSFWLPHAYGNAIAPVAALFAILTKVGVYALLRLSGTVLSGAEFTADILQPWLVPVSVITIALGAIGAMASQRLGLVVAYLIILSTGTLLAAIAVPKVETSAAVVYYIIHSTLVTAGLFLLADTIGRQRGEHEDKLERGARMRDRGALGTAFLVLAVGVSGMPPLSGFLGKMMLMRSMQPTDWAVPVWTALLLSSLVVGLVLARAASVIFWEPKTDEAEPPLPPPNLLRKSSVLALVAASPILTTLSGPVVDYTQATAEQLMARQGYLEAVLGPSPQINRERRPR